MKFPAFFDRVPRLQVHDPLANLLGATIGGELDYGYIDAVKLAGHSCPTVATAYLLGHRALGVLYPDQTPERGGLRIEFSEAESGLRLDAALASGAQFVSTDYPVPGRAFTDYVAQIPDGQPARCNPINTGPRCRDDRLELIRPKRR